MFIVEYFLKGLKTIAFVLCVIIVIISVIALVFLFVFGPVFMVTELGFSHWWYSLYLLSVCVVGAVKW